MHGYVYHEPLPEIKMTQWIKVDKKNLPKGEVLAYRQADDAVLIGTLHFNGLMVTCQNQTDMLIQISHYISIPEIPPNNG